MPTQQNIKQFKKSFQLNFKLVWQGILTKLGGYIYRLP